MSCSSSPTPPCVATCSRGLNAAAKSLPNPCPLSFSGRGERRRGPADRARRWRSAGVLVDSLLDAEASCGHARCAPGSTSACWSTARATRRPSARSRAGHRRLLHPRRGRPARLVPHPAGGDPGEVAHALLRRAARIRADGQDAWHTPGHSSGDSLRGSPGLRPSTNSSARTCCAPISVSVDMLDSLLDPRA